MNHTTIKDLYQNGQIHEGMSLARRCVRERGKEQSQLEILMLVSGLVATQQWFEAAWWIQHTEADPITKVSLQEKIDRHLPSL